METFAGSFIKWIIKQDARNACHETMTKSLRGLVGRHSLCSSRLARLVPSCAQAAPCCAVAELGGR